ncbi:MAG: ABC transporter permease [Chloracidobacterium sp.]|nr:ABC transporter permease [Chloracidobacterium sp.]
MQTFWQDLRYGARMLLKKPGFTFIALITLALGIGANTAIFTIVNAVLLRPLAYPESERLVEIGRAFDGDSAGALNEPKFVFLRDNAQSFEAITGTQGGSDIYLSDGGEAEYVGNLNVTTDFFRTLGVAPAIGRGFTAEEDSPAGPRVAILGDVLWRRRFGADTEILGRTVTLNGAAYTVVGIMPAGFEYNGPPDVILPMRVNPASRNEGYNWTVIGRLKRGVTVDQARSEMLTLIDRFNALYPNQVAVFRKEGHRLMLWRMSITADIQMLLWVLLGAVGFVLMIACANVANLQLTRAAGRRKEVAVRLALGAGGWRVVRQLLTEGVMLALVGGGAGLLLAVWGLEGMIALVPKQLIPRVEEVNVDWRVLLFALIVSVLTGVISGLTPALQTLRVDVIRNLKEGASKTGADAARGRLRGVLVIVEVALALTLTVGAGLLLRTFANLRGVDKGFDARNMLTFYISPRGERYKTMANMNDLYNRVLERLRNLPGVEAAALTNILPLNRWFNLPYMLAGESHTSGSAEYRLISDDYFNMMKMSLLRGRQFNEGNALSAEPVIIINEAFARRRFAKVEPLGQEIYACCDARGELAMRRVVGVINDTKQRALDSPAPPTVFIPIRQATEGMKDQARYVYFAMRATGDPLALSAAVREEMRQLDPSAPVMGLRSMERLVGNSVAPQRFNMSLLGLFAALGLLLSAVGIYGVMAYGVSQRAHEIGLRMALGARGGDVMKMVVKQGMALATIGVAIGLVASYALTRLLKSLLFGVSATDPLTFTVVTLSLAIVALLACWIPARRAAQFDPMIALRSE